MTWTLMSPARRTARARPSRAASRTSASASTCRHDLRDVTGMGEVDHIFGDAPSARNRRRLGRRALSKRIRSANATAVPGQFRRARASTFSAVQGARSRSASRRAVRTRLGADRGAVADAHQHALARRPGAADGAGAHMSRPSARPRAGRCGAAPARAKRSGCPARNSGAGRARPGAGGRPCRPSAAGSGPPASDR